MNHSTEEIGKYRPSTEQLLFKDCAAGSGFRKVYYDRQHSRPDSIFVRRKICFVIDTTDIKSSPIYTLQPTTTLLRRMQLNGFYRDIDMGEFIR